MALGYRLTVKSLSLEARVGIEPTNEGFADLCLTTWLPRRGSRSLSSITRPGSPVKCFRRDLITAAIRGTGYRLHLEGRPKD